MKITKGMIAWTLGTVLAVGGVSAAVAIGPIFPIPGNAPVSSTVDEPSAPAYTPTPTVTPSPTVAPVEVAPPVVVPPPAPPAPPAPAPPASSGAPSGTPLPFYPSSDPQNANGGDYADPGSFCASGSGSTINGVPTCD